MNFPTNVTELTAYINTFNSAYTAVQINEQQTFWFVAMSEARTVVDAYTLRDVASMLLGGTKKIDSEYVAEWLTSMVDDEEDPFVTLEGLINLQYSSTYNR